MCCRRQRARPMGSRKRPRIASAAIPEFESYRRHSGARQRLEPGIHKPRPWLWIPGPALTRRPAMTNVGCDRFHRIDALARPLSDRPDAWRLRRNSASRTRLKSFKHGTPILALEFRIAAHARISISRQETEFVPPYPGLPVAQVIDCGR
jgi:hypothetical protein